MMSKWIFCLLSCLAVSTIVESWDLVSLVKRSYCKRNILSAFCAPPAPATDPPPPPPPPSPASSGSDSSAYCDTNSIFAIFCTPTTPAPTPPPPPPPPSALPSYCSDPVFCALCNTCVTTTETPTTTEAETTTAAETTEAPTTTEAETTTEAATTTTEELTTTTEAETTTVEATTTTEALTEEPTTTTEEPTTTEALTTTEEPTTTTEEPTTTTEEPTTTTEEPTTTEALTTTEAPTTTTIPEKLCPDPSVNVRYRRVVDGTPSASCDIPGAVRLFHPVFGVVLCTGVLIDASTVQVPKSCGDVATLPHIIGELELTVGDGADEQKAKASSAADGSVPGTTEITLDTPYDVTVCPGLPCMYDAATMEGYIDFTKCSAGGYGTTQEAAVGETPKYSGLQGFTIDSIDETSCAIPAGTTPYSCAITSTGSPCTGDGGGPVTCEAVTGEQVVIGQVEDFPCDTTKPFSFIDFTKA